MYIRTQRFITYAALNAQARTHAHTHVYTRKGAVLRRYIWLKY